MRDEILQSQKANEKRQEQQSIIKDRQLASSRLLDALLPNYSELSNAVLVSEVSKEEKIKAWNALDQRVLDLINDSINRLKTRTLSNAEVSSTWSDQLNTLNDLKIQLAENSNQRLALLNEDPSKVSITLKSVQEIVNTIDPAFETEITRIKEDPSLTKEEKYLRIADLVTNMRNVLAENTMNNIDQLVSNAQNPTNYITKSERAEVEKELNAVLQIAKEQFLSDQDIQRVGFSIQEQQLIQQLDKKYLDERKLWDLKSNPTTKELDNQIKKEKQLLASLQSALLQLEKKSTSDDPAIQSDNLKRLIAKQEGRISSLEAQITVSQKQASNIEVIQRIDPTYIKDVKSTEKMTNDEERVFFLLAREKQLNGKKIVERTIGGK